MPVLRVEKTALKLAEKYHADHEKVSIAALSHDYAKERPDEEMRDLIISEDLDLEMLQYGNNIWHGPIGAVLMKNEYHLEDEEVLEAIDEADLDVEQIEKLYSMLEAAGTGVAMGNAREDVKALGFPVCLTNDEDGVARYIDENILR